MCTEARPRGERGLERSLGAGAWKQGDLCEAHLFQLHSREPAHRHACEGPGGIQAASHLVIGDTVNLVLFPPPRNAKIRVFGCFISPVCGQEDVPAFVLLSGCWSQSEQCLGAHGRLGNSMARSSPCWALRCQGGGQPLRWLWVTHLLPGRASAGAHGVHRAWTFPRAVHLCVVVLWL